MANSFKRVSSSRCSARLTALSFVSDAVNRSLDVREIADNALHTILAVMKLHAGVVYSWDQGAKVLRPCACRGLPDELSRSLAIIPQGENALVDAVLEDNARIVENLKLMPVAFRVDFLKTGFRSSVIVPIHAHGVVAGMLGLCSVRIRQFESEDVELVQVIANQIGVAMANAQLLSDLQKKNTLLKLLVEEAHHRIKNNLQMISGLLQLEAEATRHSDCHAHLRTVVSRIQAIAYVHNLLSEEMPKHVDVEQLVGTIVRTLVQAAPRSGSPPEVRLNLERVQLNAEQAVALALIVNELVANALMHGCPKKGAPLQLSVSCRKQGDAFGLVVSDNGGGLQDVRSESAGQGQGQGIGIVRQLAKVNLRGNLDIKDSGDGVSAELHFQT